MDYRYYGYHDSYYPRYYGEHYFPKSRNVYYSIRSSFEGGRPSPPKVNYDTRFKNDSHYYY